VPIEGPPRAGRSTAGPGGRRGEAGNRKFAREVSSARRVAWVTTCGGGEPCSGGWGAKRCRRGATKERRGPQPRKVRRVDKEAWAREEKDYTGWTWTGPPL